MGPVVEALSGASLVLLLVGGGLYSLGVVFHLWHRLPYHNAVWHAFVLAAAICHYIAVMRDGALRY
jgi:hemolysin III